MGNKKYLGDPEDRVEEAKLAREFQKSSKGFNEIQHIVSKGITHFFEKISLYSAGTISLSITALVSIHRLEGTDIQQYKWIYLLGLGALLLSFVMGISYVYINSLENYYLNKTNWGVKALKYQEFIDSLPPSGETVELEVRDLVNSDKRKNKWFNFLSKLIKWACIPTFLIGVVLLSLYFSIQLFDF
jgi:hypothetical protein